MHSNLSTCNKNNGFSFIEILIVLFVFSLILTALSQTQLKNTHQVGGLYFEQIAQRLMNNSYEQCQIQPMHASIQSAGVLLPQGEGIVMSTQEHLFIEISWANRFSQNRNQLKVDI